MSESNEETGAYDPLDRLKMAINYEEKKVSLNHPSPPPAAAAALVGLLV